MSKPNHENENFDRETTDLIRLIQLGTIICGLAVVLGAFGAHALKGAIGEWYDPETAANKLESWETGVRYQFFHGLAIMLLAILGQPARRVAGLIRHSICQRSAVFFLIGIVVFSGGLYVWVLTDLKPFVLAVPLGGASFIIGWLVLVVGSMGRQSNARKH